MTKGKYRSGYGSFVMLEQFKALLHVYVLAFWKLSVNSGHKKTLPITYKKMLTNLASIRIIS